jgi:type VI protein secretion system component VasK
MALPAAILMVGAATCLPVMAAAQASALAGYSILASQQARVVAVGLSGAGVEAFVSQFFL